MLVLLVVEQTAEEEFAALNRQVGKIVFCAPMQQFFAVLRGQQRNQLGLAEGHKGMLANVVPQLIQQHPTFFVKPFRNHQVPRMQIVEQHLQHSAIGKLLPHLKLESFFLVVSEHAGEVLTGNG